MLSVAQYFGVVGGVGSFPAQPESDGWLEHRIHNPEVRRKRAIAQLVENLHGIQGGGRSERMQGELKNGES